MKTKRILAIALSIVMLFSLIPHAFAEDIAAMLAEYQKQAEAMQQEFLAQQQAAQQALLRQQEDYQQQVLQQQAELEKKIRQETCNHDNQDTYIETDENPDDGVHIEVTYCRDCEAVLLRKEVEDIKDGETETKSMTLRTALKAGAAKSAETVYDEGTCDMPLKMPVPTRMTLRRSRSATVSQSMVM